MGIFTDTSSEGILTAVDTVMTNYCGTLSEGDERKIFSQALGMIMVAAFNLADDLAYQRTLQGARGEALDAIGDTVTRLEAEKATTTLRFSISETQSMPITIPAGTRASTAEGLMFETTEAGTITAGSIYVDIPAQAENGGEDYNGIEAGYINVIVDRTPIPDVETVQNMTITKGGDDGEPNDDEGNESYRNRIRLANSTSSTAGPTDRYKYFALSADSLIADASVYTPSNEAGTVYIRVILDGGELPTSEINEKVLEACTSNKVKPSCDLVKVQTPDQVEYDITLKYYVNPDSEDETVELVEGDNGAIAQYVSWQDQTFGRDITPDELRYLIMNAGATRVTMTYPTDTEIPEYKIAKWSGSLSIEHVVNS